jgi:hypothetical protein
LTPTGPILPFLCLIYVLCGSASAQVTAPKPAGFLPEAEKWVREHAHSWSQGGELAARVGAAKSLVLVAPAQSEPAQRCMQIALEREDPLLIGVCAGWGEAAALDAWLADGKGAAPTLLDKPTLDAARAWNVDAKHTKKLRAAGLEYRLTQPAAIGLVEFVARIDPQLEERAGQLLGPFRQIGLDGKNRYEKVDDNWRFAVQQMLSDLHEQAGERREEWTKLLGAETVANGIRNLEHLRQAEQEVSKPAEFSRGRALCANAAAARDDLAPGSALALLLPPDCTLEAQDARTALGEQTLVVLVLQSKDDPDLATLARVQPAGMLDLRELPTEGLVATWFEAHFKKRADVVLWAPPR